MTRRSLYAGEIERVLSHHGVTDVDPVLVEGWMRLEYSTLDGLGSVAFDRSALESAQCVLVAPAESIELARSYGLLPREEVADGRGR